jgi:hypothetical protein
LDHRFADEFSRSDAALGLLGVIEVGCASAKAMASSKVHPLSSHNVRIRGCAA